MSNKNLYNPTAEAREKELRESKRKKGTNLWEKYNLPDPTTCFDVQEDVIQLEELSKDGEHMTDAVITLCDRFVDRVQTFSEEQGVVGTYHVDGRIIDEPNPRYRPYLVRGQQSMPGVYDRAYRDSNAFRSVNEIRNLLVNAHWDISLPEDADDLNSEHAQWLWKKFQDVKVGDMGQRGFPAFLEAIMTMLKRGFSIFQMVWAQDTNGWKYPKEILFRLQSTVYRWIIDLELDELVMVQFKAGGDVRSDYSLFTKGKKLTDKEVLLFTLNREGNNYEGISPLRPGLHWIALKTLFSTIAATAADIHGVPARYVRNAIEAITSVDTPRADEDQLEKVMDALIEVEEGDATVITLPDGSEVGVLERDGTMLDLKPLIEYCDLQINTPFSSEGSLLGHQQVGSYGMAEQSDKQFLSQIPYYEYSVSNPLNDLIRQITIENIGEQEEYASVEMRFDVSRDNQKYISDLISLMNNSVWTWPEPMQESILDEMGLPTDVFDGWDPQALLDSLQAQAPPEPSFGESSDPLAMGAGNPLLSFFRKKRDHSIS